MSGGLAPIGASRGLSPQPRDRSATHAESERSEHGTREHSRRTPHDS
jgi:hypothetical protein